MNRQIVRLSVVALALLAALVVETTYWQTWAPSGLAARQDNAILRVAQFKIRRGLIYSADGRLVASASMTVALGCGWSSCAAPTWRR